LDDLRAAAAEADPQFQLSSNEVAPVLTALIAHLDPESAAPAVEEAAPVDPVASDQAAAAAAQQATAQQTQVEHQPGAPA
jgi:hypothetical protein